MAVNNHEDILDSRDIIARIEELENDDERGAAEEDELSALKALADEASGSPDWQHGEALIRDTYFTDYAQQLAEDCCEMPTDNRWPMYCIDWEWAARDLKMDYTSVDFDGVEDWILS